MTPGEESLDRNRRLYRECLDELRIHIGDFITQLYNRMVQDGDPLCGGGLVGGDDTDSDDEDEERIFQSARTLFRGAAARRAAARAANTIDLVSSDEEEESLETSAAAGAGGGPGAAAETATASGEDFDDLAERLGYGGVFLSRGKPTHPMDRRRAQREVLDMAGNQMDPFVVLAQVHTQRDLEVVDLLRSKGRKRWVDAGKTVLDGEMAKNEHREKLLQGLCTPQLENGTKKPLGHKSGKYTTVRLQEAAEQNPFLHNGGPKTVLASPREGDMKLVLGFLQRGRPIAWIQIRQSVGNPGTLGRAKKACIPEIVFLCSAGSGIGSVIILTAMARWIQKGYRKNKATRPIKELCNGILLPQGWFLKTGVTEESQEDFDGGAPPLALVNLYAATMGFKPATRLRKRDKWWKDRGYTDEDLELLDTIVKRGAPDEDHAAKPARNVGNLFFRKGPTTDRDLWWELVKLHGKGLLVPA